MKLKKCKVSNFGSYKELEFDFSDLGLTLVYGATGSGKSTLQDIAPWIIYGITAKDGNVDEVRSWQTPDQPTIGTIEIETNNGIFSVTRVRGRPNQNDLYLTENGTVTRGKDITDTQSLISTRLAVPGSTYLSSAYFHEFAKTGTFFSAKSKERRAVFEEIASLALPAKVAEKAAAAKKELKKKIEKTQIDVATIIAKKEQVSSTINKIMSIDMPNWNFNHGNTILSLQEKYDNFESTKQSNINALNVQAADFEKERQKNIDSLVKKLANEEDNILNDEDFIYELTEIDEQLLINQREKCKTCGGPGKHDPNLHTLRAALVERRHENSKLTALCDELMASIERARDQVNPFIGKIETAKNTENNYGVSLLAEKARINPFLNSITELSAVSELHRASAERYESALSQMKSEFNSLSQVYDLSFVLRRELLKKHIKAIEASTNGYLERYFDAEIRVTFTADDAETEDVVIFKSGYECVYRQLSKGQRGLLRLCFVIAVMEAAANRSSTHFDNLMFDEALDGLDSDLKVKAFGLFQELATKHETIILIDHSPDFQQMFSRRYKVELVEDHSRIREDD